MEYYCCFFQRIQEHLKFSGLDFCVFSSLCFLGLGFFLTPTLMGAGKAVCECCLREMPKDKSLRAAKNCHCQQNPHKEILGYFGWMGECYAYREWSDCHTPEEVHGNELCGPGKSSVKNGGRGIWGLGWRGEYFPLVAASAVI